jgi:hypothetical protein
MLQDPMVAGAFDVVHVSPHLVGLGIVQSGWTQPLSVIFDAPVRQAKVSRLGLTLPIVERRFRTLLLDEEKVIRRADRLFAMSHWAAAGMAAHYGLATESIMVVPPVRTVVPRSWEGEDGQAPVRIAFVGNNLERKGGRRLVAWHQKHWVDRAELHVFTSSANPLGDLPGVIWHHSVQNQAIVTEHLRTMDMFVLPTRSDMSPLRGQRGRRRRLAGCVQRNRRHERSGARRRHRLPPRPRR